MLWTQQRAAVGTTQSPADGLTSATEIGTRERDARRRACCTSCGPGNLHPGSRPLPKGKCWQRSDLPFSVDAELLNSFLSGVSPLLCAYVLGCVIGNSSKIECVIMLEFAIINRAAELILLISFGIAALPQDV